MKHIGQRFMAVTGLLLALFLLAACPPATEPLPPPTTAVLATDEVEPTLPPPTETTAPPTSTSEPPPTETAEPPTPTTEPSPTSPPDPTEAPDSPVDIEVGIIAYQSNGCIGCHTLAAAEAVGAVGPSHDSIATTAQERIADPAYTGNATTAEEYIRESILEPGIFTVPGYPENVMPSFSTIADEQIDAIVAMLLEQR